MEKEKLELIILKELEDMRKLDDTIITAMLC